MHELYRTSMISSNDLKEQHHHDNLGKWNVGNAEVGTRLSSEMKLRG